MKAIVVEDSRLARNELVKMVEALGRFEHIYTASDGDDAIIQIKEHNPEVIFLDIHLPGKNGFEVLEALDFVPPVIFTTAFDEYAIKSFEYNAIDYLMKPISQERLAKALEKLPMESKEKQEKLSVDQQVFVRDGDKCWFVKIEDIRLFESMGNYTRIYFENEKPMILKSLSYLEEILEDKRFFRANRQEIINVKFVNNIAPSFNGKLKITLITGEEVEVSRRQSAEFKAVFGI
ncbi:LytR/AlgR family response regulator transcription factor [Portibacter lacus]|uniref:DNA-binding response regulator n=1 Tax=Portibacter lacus TaxID=1099794 RepID=A0AA37SRE9_9BACT|nr:LytTR family DNA-binding domain-containing protein [Portibacter lacus]GLR18487.1 DNA-binding response regulator [Portibacter lacus]